jgi:hypothetical protein
MREEEEGCGERLARDQRSQVEGGDDDACINVQVR